MFYSKIFYSIVINIINFIRILSSLNESVGNGYTKHKTQASYRAGSPEHIKFIILLGINVFVNFFFCSVLCIFLHVADHTKEEIQSHQTDLQIIPLVTSLLIYTFIIEIHQHIVLVLMFRSISHFDTYYIKLIHSLWIL